MTLYQTSEFCFCWTGFTSKTPKNTCVRALAMRWAIVFKMHLCFLDEVLEFKNQILVLKNGHTCRNLWMKQSLHFAFYPSLLVSLIEIKNSSAQEWQKTKTYENFSSLFNPEVAVIFNLIMITFFTVAVFFGLCFTLSTCLLI